MLRKKHYKKILITLSVFIAVFTGITLFQCIFIPYIQNKKEEYRLSVSDVENYGGINKIISELQELKNKINSLQNSYSQAENLNLQLDEDKDILNDKYYSSEELSKELKSANQKSYNKLKQEYNTLLEEYHKLTEDYENYKKEHENRN